MSEALCLPTSGNEEENYVFCAEMTDDPVPKNFPDSFTVLFHSVQGKKGTLMQCPGKQVVHIWY